MDVEGEGHPIVELKEAREQAEAKAATLLGLLRSRAYGRRRGLKAVWEANGQAEQSPKAGDKLREVLAPDVPDEMRTRFEAMGRDVVQGWHLASRLIYGVGVAGQTASSPGSSTIVGVNTPIKNVCRQAIGASDCDYRLIEITHLPKLEEGADAGQAAQNLRQAGEGHDLQDEKE